VVADIFDNPGTSGPIILWLDYGYEGWQPYSFNTVKQALEANKFGSTFIITRKADYVIKETK
jgi:hypothetical protein